MVTAWGSNRVALVTGASRGLGFAVVRRLCDVFDGTIYLTAHTRSRGRMAMKRLKKLGCVPEFRVLDVTRKDDRLDVAREIRQAHGGLDMLVNNAALRYPANTTVEMNHLVNHTLRVNFHAILMLSQVFLPLLRPHARVVNVGSPCGHLTDIPSHHVRDRIGDRGLTLNDLKELMKGYQKTVERGIQMSTGWGNSPYCISKVALTAYTYIQQRHYRLRRPDCDLTVNCYSPGPITSKINRFSGAFKTDKSAENVVALASLPPGCLSPVGQFVWHDMRIVPWRGEKPNMTKEELDACDY